MHGRWLLGAHLFPWLQHLGHTETRRCFCCCRAAPSPLASVFARRQILLAAAARSPFCLLTRTPSSPRAPAAASDASVPGGTCSSVRGPVGQRTAQGLGGGLTSGTSTLPAALPWGPASFSGALPGPILPLTSQGQPGDRPAPAGPSWGHCGCRPHCVYPTQLLSLGFVLPQLRSQGRHRQPPCAPQHSSAQ